MPGLTALNTGGDVGIAPLSCAAPGDCGAGGFYTDGAGRRRAFVADEVHGTWRRVRQVPGIAALDAGRAAVIRSVSCAAPGDCSAGGFYESSRRDVQAFTVAEVHGTWRRAQRVPGLAALNTGGDAAVASLSCAAVGQCVAAGVYTDGAGHAQAFTVGEVHGTWRRARQVPGFAALNKSQDAEVSSVSCSAAGDCSAGGFYTDGVGRWQAFVVDEVHGTWRRARQVPGTAALNKGRGAGSASLAALSCAAAGSCSAGGSYTDGAGHRQVFIVSKP